MITLLIFILIVYLKGWNRLGHTLVYLSLITATTVLALIGGWLMSALTQPDGWIQSWQFVGYPMIMEHVNSIMKNGWNILSIPVVIIFWSAYSIFWNVIFHGSTVMWVWLAIAAFANFNFTVAYIGVMQGPVSNLDSFLDSL
jgi:hypothetical protein